MRRTTGRLVLATAGVVLILFAVLLWWQRGAGRGGRADGASRPDVLLITVDTLRADYLGCYGRRGAETPNIDALARNGVRFEHAVAHVPLTLPSHASLLTGLTPLRHGVRDNAGFVLAEGVPTLAEWMREAGYVTAAFVSAFPVHGRFGLAQGFSVYDDRFPRGDDLSRPAYVERRGDQTVTAALGWLRGVANAGSPVFTWVHLFDPHTPYTPPGAFAPRFANREYEGEIAFADQQIGALLEEWTRVRGRTPVVMVTSDHGEGLGEHSEPTHGLFIYDSTIRVPLILGGPGIPAGRTVAPLARGIDVAPTLLDLAGLQVPGNVEGRSLRDAWTRTGWRDEPAYVESLFGRLSFGWAPLHGWRERQWMYISAPTPELYDIASDPGQHHNLAATRPEDARRFDRAVGAAAATGADPARQALSRDARERMQALGYVSGGSPANPSLRDPKELAAVAVRIENALAVERSDPRRAISELQAVLVDDPPNPLARRHLAVAFNAAGRHDQAAAEVRRLIDQGDASEETVAFLGDSLRLAGRLEEALALLRGAVDNGKARTTETFTILGKTLLQLGRPQEAAGAFERARGIVADDGEALTGLAEASMATGDLPAARRWFEALRARDPDDRGTALKLGVVLVRLGQVEQALPLLQQSAEGQPGNVDAVVALGGALAKVGRPAEAAAHFERAISAGAASPIVWNSLAMARLQSGDRAGAAVAFRKSLRARPDQPDVRDWLRRLER